MIVVRGLVPGGAAHQDGRIIPGDRVIRVNQTQLTQASLDLAVQALKGAPLGLVRVGVCKPRNTDALNTQDSLVSPAFLLCPCPVLICSVVSWYLCFYVSRLQICPGMSWLVFLIVVNSKYIAVVWLVWLPQC